MSRSVPMTANFPGLVKLLAQHLYPEKAVFLREMIQNAHDSLVRRLDREPGHCGRIDVIADPARQTITFADNGTGMTADEVVRFLTVIGESGTDEYRRKMNAEGRSGVEQMIGQFGIGLLSGFLVADRITVETRSMSGAPAVRWTYEGDTTSSLADADLPDLTAGTRVALRIKGECRHFLQPDALQENIVRFADFLPFPIHLNHGPASVNLQQAPWHRTWPVDELREREYTRFVQRRFRETPLEVVPVDLVEPVPAHGVLFITDRRVAEAGTVGTVDLYNRRMFVREGEPHLLPPWARFVRGTIDSPALALTASRSDVQRDTPAFESLRTALAALLLAHLHRLAETAPRRFQKLVRWHHTHVRAMAVAHEEFFRAVAHLIPFETDTAHRAEGLLTLPEICARQRPDPATGAIPLWYFTEAGAGAQFQEMCGARGLVVVDASWPWDEEFLQKYATAFPGRIELRKLDADGGAALFDPADARESERFARLLAELDRLLRDAGGDRPVRAVAERFHPTDLPAVVTSADPSDTRRKLEEMTTHPLFGEGLSAYARELAGELPQQPVLLHVNVLNPLAQRLADAAGDPEIHPWLLALYNNGMLYSSQFHSARNLRTLYGQTVRLLDQALDQRAERARLTRELDATRSRLARFEARP